MKKRYLALILACIMMSSLSLSACGRISDAVVSHDEDDEDEDDDRDDHDDRDDEDDEEDEEEDKPSYVEVIDDDDLKDQIKALVKNRDDWTVDFSSEDSIRSTSYGVTDLDHNGRVEIVVLVEYADDSETTELRIFEVDEKAKAVQAASWKMKGLDIGPEYPGTFTHGSIPTYYDRKKKENHYMLENMFFPASGPSGMVYFDLCYFEGKVTCYKYAAMIIDSPISVEYLVDGRNDIHTDAEFAAFIGDYPDQKREPENIHFGMYYRQYHAIDDIGYMDDSELKTFLKDSYYVFAGEMDYGEFEANYNSDSYTTGVSDGFVEGDILEDILGTWYLYSAEIDGDITYYDEKSAQFMDIAFYDDETVLLTEYSNGDISFRMNGQLLRNDYGDRYWSYEGDGMSDGVDYEIYTVTSLSNDGNFLTVYLDFCSYTDGSVGGFTLVFIR